MKDRWGRTIDYMRLSITDRCNLRCKYCMPTDVPYLPHNQIIRYDELLRLCRIATDLGITKFKITGGEPFVRKKATEFMVELKQMEGVENVTLTTNGIYLLDHLDALCQAKIDGINISMDTLNAQSYAHISGSNQLEIVTLAIKTCVESGIRTKINLVMLDENKDQFAEMALLAKTKNLDIRFIEIMSIGHGKEYTGPTGEEGLALLQAQFPDIHLVDEKRGNGPARYYQTDDLQGRIGFICANSHKFCESCNRVRLTSTGILKPCLCYEDGVDMLSIMRSNASDEEIKQAMFQAIYEKPYEHSLDTVDMTEYRMMNAIGG